jgi:cobalt/nickel transport system ATP-binding protein
MIEIQNLNFTYPDGRKALDGIHLKIQAGERVGLIGPNGAGKSTFLYHLNGVLSGEGEIIINNMVLEKRNIPAIRAMVGLVFQNPDDQLFSSSVYEDVAYGPLYQGLSKNEVNAHVSHALELVGMSEYIHRNSYHLSVGEKKRIAIATVLSMNPEILVLDEPTAGLDPRGRREIIGILLNLPQTLIIATHDLDLVEKLLNRVLIISSGQIVVDGEAKTILKNKDLLEKHGLF